MGGLCLSSFCCRLSIFLNRFNFLSNFFCYCCCLKTLDNTQCGEPINIMITPMNFLIINCENEIKEYINLFNSAENIKGLYKGNSLLIIQKMPVIYLNLNFFFKLIFLLKLNFHSKRIFFANFASNSSTTARRAVKRTVWIVWEVCASTSR